MLLAVTHLTDRFFSKAKGVSNPGSSLCMHAASALSEPWVNFTQWTPSNGKQFHHCIVKESRRNLKTIKGTKEAEKTRKSARKLCKSPSVSETSSTSLWVKESRQDGTQKAVILPLESVREQQDEN